jgi:hypothetical protein
VIVRVPPKGARYEVRELATGRVIARGSTEDELLGVTANLFLRSTQEGAMSATDVESGHEVWTRPVDGFVPVLAESVRSDWLGITDGGLILQPRLETLPDVSARDALRLLDPRTGKVTEHPVDLPSGTVEVYPTSGPDVTAETARRGVTPRVPVLQAMYPDNDALQVDGRRLDGDDIDSRSIDVTARQIAWESPSTSFPGSDADAISVYDRATGKRLVHYVSEEVRVRAVGERLVIGSGPNEDSQDREYVVAA